VKSEEWILFKNNINTQCPCGEKYYG